MLFFIKSILFAFLKFNYDVSSHKILKIEFFIHHFRFCLAHFWRKLAVKIGCCNFFTIADSKNCHWYDCGLICNLSAGDVCKAGHSGGSVNNPSNVLLAHGTTSDNLVSLDFDIMDITANLNPHHW